MKYLLLLFFLLAGWKTSAQETYKVHYTPEDVRIFNTFCMENRHLQHLPMHELVVETGKYFLGTPYVNFTLEIKDPEELIVNLRELDCVTFVETTVALARCIKAGNYDFDYYCEILRNLRYRDGKLFDFTSRLHYFSDWIANNQEMGLVKDRTDSLGGLPYPIKVNMMSTKPNNYRQLKANPALVPILKDIEENIINTRTMAYIPQEKADAIAMTAQSGSIVGTTTGWLMDITHCGFLVHVNGKPHFMHASSVDKKVVLTDVTLQGYLQSKSTMNGFMAVEVLEPGQSRVPRTQLYGILTDSEEVQLKGLSPEHLTPISR
ncbi:MAG: DUF1460 domain-containing protein [Rikenellaceae bacterium]|nr:DUF1460 domain-containing protein [Rikenellaceae bacterium]